MKKSDLISGKHIVEIREDEKRFLLLGDKFLSAEEFCEFRGISPDLLHKQFEQLDIVKIYEIEEYQDLNSMLNEKKGLKLVWERKPELSEAERVILKNVHKDCKYIVRDGHGKLCLFSKKPKKFCDIWVSSFPESIGFYPFNHLFKMVKWEDEEPTLIADLLEGKQ